MIPQDNVKFEIDLYSGDFIYLSIDVNDTCYTCNILENEFTLYSEIKYDFHCESCEDETDEEDPLPPVPDWGLVLDLGNNCQIQLLENIGKAYLTLHFNEGNACIKLTHSDAAELSRRILYKIHDAQDNEHLICDGADYYHHLSFVEKWPSYCAMTEEYKRC